MTRFMRLTFCLLVVCLVTQLYIAVATFGPAPKVTTAHLIRLGCAKTPAPPLCAATLKMIASNPFMNPCDVTTFAVQAAMKTAKATFDIINMSLNMKSQIIADPAIKQSLTTCANEYKTAIEVMTKATTCLQQKVNTPQVPDFLNQAVGCVAKCDGSLSLIHI